MLKIEIMIDDNGDFLVHKSSGLTVDSVGKVLLALEKVKSDIVSEFNIPGPNDN